MNETPAYVKRSVSDETYPLDKTEIVTPLSKFYRK